MQRKHNKEIVPIAKSLRKNMTKEEKHLWYDFLCNYPVRFSRQKVLGKYIADFYCVKANLIIELDGSGHYTEKGKQYDEERTVFLEKYGLKVVRIPNTEIHKNFRMVCEYIDGLVKQSLRHAMRATSLYTMEPFAALKMKFPQTVCLVCGLFQLFESSYSVKGLDSVFFICIRFRI